MPTKTVKTMIKPWANIAANWASVNPVIPVGVWAVESDTGRMKLGVGMAWSGTQYSGNEKQDAIVTTGASNVLTAPTTAGGQPGSMPAASLRGQEFVTAPNYSTQEGTNRITANNGTWVVSQDGYVNVSIRATSAASAICTINGKWVGQSYSGTSTGSQAFLTGVYPVSVGDVVKLFVDAGSAGNIGCYFIPPKVVTTQTTPTLANSLTTMGPPDYAAVSVVVDLTSSIANGALLWTADIDCYVNVIVTATGAPGSIYVDAQPPGKPSTQVFVGGEKTAGDRFAYQLKVVQGTKIYTGADSSTRVSRIILNKIPPIINPPLYVDGQPLVNYSTSEQDTGIKWLNGKSIYQITVTGNIVGAANTPITTSLPVTAALLIYAECLWQFGANSSWTSGSLDNNRLIGVFHTPGSQVNVRTISSSERTGTTNNAYIITLRYTKT